MPVAFKAADYGYQHLNAMLAALTGSRHGTDLSPAGPLLSAGGGHGVASATDFVVTAGSGLTLSVSAGSGFIRGTQTGGQGVMVVWETSATTVTPTAPDGSNPRIDLVIAEADADGELDIRMVDGTPAAIPSAPSVPDDSLVLAHVLIEAGAVSAAADYTITDKRTRAYALGGTVVCTSATRPNPTFEGQLIYETDTDRLYVYDGSSWDPVSVGRRFNSGLFDGATDSGGNVVVAHGLGAAPVAVTITLTTGSTVGTIKVAQPSIGGTDSTNFAVTFVRSDTGGFLEGNAIQFMWIATT